ncbi:diguanylate cyclase [Pantoea eucrina]|uniref:GGDEF domain-containing protein n=1 Tax=Pantoea eucrina TaxID=472693 RepID=UPI002FD89757
MRVSLFDEHNDKKNALTLFLITLFFCFLGSHLRVPEEFSLFWPVNALIAGLIVRQPFLHTPSSYLVALAAMIFNDTVFSGWAFAAVTINIANILFTLVAVCMLIAVVLSLTAGALIGGAGSLTFPVPALIWCAIVLPMPVTSVVILLTGITEIVLVSHGVMNIQGNDALLPIGHLTSARLGVATVALSPLLVAVSMDAIRQLNQRLALRANVDVLTQQLSRSGLYEQLKQMPFSLQRHTGVIMLDVDYFKTINDNFGHDAGDSVLEEIGRRIQQVAQQQGMICRFGGEEFVIVVFDAVPEQLYRLAESVRQALAREKFWIKGNSVTVTASMGLAWDCARHEREWPEVINRLISAADKHLYSAKRNGRNQVAPAAALSASHVA